MVTPSRLRRRLCWKAGWIHSNRLIYYNDIIMKNSHPLLELLEKDQIGIRQYKDEKIDAEKYNKINQEVIYEFKEYIKNNGFPFKNLYGQDVYKAAVVLALHTSNDFLESIFEIIKEAGENQIDIKDKAYFIDRILVYRGKPQIYGMQFKISIDGLMEPLSIEDPHNVNKRRAEIGLELIEKYKKRVEEQG